MDGSEARDRYLDFLIEQIRADRYPSVAALNRIEGVLPPERLGEYLDLLFEKLQDSRFPSVPLLDRIERLTTPSGP
jgi:hypothetical protein